MNGRLVQRVVSSAAWVPGAAWACSPGPEAADAMARADLIALGSFLLCAVVLIWQAVVRKEAKLARRLAPFLLLPFHPVLLLSGLTTRGDCGQTTAWASSIVAALALVGFGLITLRRRQVSPQA